MSDEREIEFQATVSFEGIDLQVAVLSDFFEVDVASDWDMTGNPFEMRPGENN